METARKWNEKLLLTCIFHRVDSDIAFCPCQTSGKYHSNILQTVHGTAHRSAVPLNKNKHQWVVLLHLPVKGSKPHSPAVLSDTRSTAPPSPWTGPFHGSPLHHDIAGKHTVYHSKVPAVHGSTWLEFLSIACLPIDLSQGQNIQKNMASKIPTVTQSK